MGAVKHSSTAANAAPTTKLAHEMNEEIFFTLWWLFSPSATEIIALPPMPNMLANAISRMKIGLVRLTAATCRASPVCPTKKVSAMLYTTVTRLLMTLGIAIAATARGIGALPRRVSLSKLFTFLTLEI